MKLFLKLKHWQFFLIWIAGAILTEVTRATTFWFLSSLITVCLIFGWIYSMGRVLNLKNKQVIKRLNIWSIVYLISVIPLAVNSHNLTIRSFSGINSIVIIFSGIVGFFGLVNILLIITKSFAKEENKKNLTFNEYAKYFFFISCVFIGVWILQPKLNKFLESTE